MTKLIADLRDIHDKKERRMAIIKDELIEIKEKYGDERRSEIIYSASEMRMEDLIADEEVVIPAFHMPDTSKEQAYPNTKSKTEEEWDLEALKQEKDFLEGCCSYQSQLSFDIY